MLDSDLDTIYKANIGVSHYAALRGVWDAGYAAGAGVTTTPNTTDFSQAQAAPTVDPVISGSTP